MNINTLLLIGLGALLYCVLTTRKSKSGGQVAEDSDHRLLLFQAAIPPIASPNLEGEAGSYAMM